MGHQKIKTILYGVLVSVPLFNFNFSTIVNAQENNFFVSHLSRAAKYAQTAYRDSVAGEWRLAREGWEKAVEHIELTDAANRTRAVFYYEFGHAAGITCHFEIAEEFLEKSYQLEKTFNGPYILTLVEIFRLYFDQKYYKMASIYFEAALPNLRAANAEEKTPVRFTRLLDEYAKSLSYIDRQKLAQQIKKQSRAIKMKMAIEDQYDKRTLYGSRCDDSNFKQPMTIAQTASVSLRMSKIREILRTMKK
ncbi:hypothetical protein MNBD_GAMMA22-1140 [hydrothermal vent metagenome]|uniref:Outer membrane lipoprotein BamD-like domain-containing protein n=1 Tax=hydrothermal vent metagenome TaxID=652676 RepID=A0A3B1A2Y8_9ZZZZ